MGSPAESAAVTEGRGSHRSLVEVGSGTPRSGARGRRHSVDPFDASHRRLASPPHRPTPAGARVLIVDDDEIMRMLVSRFLAQDGFGADEACDATTALDAIRRRRPDLVLLDVVMPGRDGLDLLEQLRRDSDLPVILVTSRGDEADRVMGLRLGADDYIVKPFSPAELVARVTAVLRRGGSQRPTRLDFAGLSIDVATRRLTVEDRPVPTTAKEFDLLVLLASSPSQVFTREQILGEVWGSSSDWQDPGTVTEHVRRIRHVIEADVAHPRWIRTVRGVGYCFEP